MPKPKFRPNFQPKVGPKSYFNGPHKQVYTFGPTASAGPTGHRPKQAYWPARPTSSFSRGLAPQVGSPQASRSPFVCPCIRTSYPHRPHDPADRQAAWPFWHSQVAWPTTPALSPSERPCPATPWSAQSHTHARCQSHAPLRSPPSLLTPHPIWQACQATARTAHQTPM